MDFTQEELQLIYTACMGYGDKLPEKKQVVHPVKGFPHGEEPIRDEISKKADKYWRVARKVTKYI